MTTPPVVGGVQAHQDRQHRGLAAARVAEEADELALVHVQGEVADDDRRTGRRVVRLAELGDLDEGGHGQLARRRQARRNSTMPWRAFW